MEILVPISQSSDSILSFARNKSQLPITPSGHQGILPMAAVSFQLIRRSQKDSKAADLPSPRKHVLQLWQASDTYCPAIAKTGSEYAPCQEDSGGFEGSPSLFLTRAGCFLQGCG